MSPSGGETTVVLHPITWSPGNSTASSSRAKHVWLEVWPGVCTARIVQPGPRAAMSPSATRTSGSKARSSASSTGTSSAESSSSLAAAAGAVRRRSSALRSPRAATPPAVSGRCGSGSRRSRSPARWRVAAAMASRWESSTGPGSITATSPSPMMYVPVPRYVNFDGFSAITRRIIGATRSTRP